ncbi:hypothetical protein DXG01_015516 [Tephrocybe rancida]|nr:hypothetical protein DXG01_015516 [Tephrocybe rancida]
MQQTPEAEAFLNRILALPKGPGDSLDEALQPSLDDEAELRKLFATDKDNTRLADPLVGLVDVFDAPEDIRTTRARVVKDEEDLSRRHVMPLSESNRRKEGTPSMVADLEEFKKNWAIFTEGSLSQLIDWNNVVAAGGAVLGCLSPLSDANKESKRSIRKYYHSVAYPTSDVDLFLWGMDAEQAEKKIKQIYEAVRDSVPWDVTCVRTKHTVSIHSQYPYRSVQIVLRLYASPAEILAGFDIDAPCCLYNGQRVIANPRAIVAMMRQSNTVDMTRRSPSYEVRLAKYSGRAFEVHVPTLERRDIDPTIYERSIARIEGLARLLVLEKLTNTSVRYDFLESRRRLRGRPNPLNRYAKRKNKYKGDLKTAMSAGGLEMNDYDVQTLHIPYGPGWTARRIDKLIYQTDLSMNSTFNPKNKDRRLHRHPAFFGTMEECLEDCCEHCPEPIDEDERKLQEEEDKTLLRGRIAFIEEDPGRQSMSGSFNPIDVGEWSAQVYIGPTAHFFNAIAAGDLEGVSKMLESTPPPSDTGTESRDGIDVNRRDHVGRTALHVALLTRNADIACVLIDAGARMTARLVDGRSALHLAAQYDLPGVVKKMFEKSKSNRKEAEERGDVEVEDEEGKMDVDRDREKKEKVRPSSEDDWTSEDDAFGVVAMDTDMEDEGEGDDEGGEGKDKGSRDEDMEDDEDGDGSDEGGSGEDGDTSSGRKKGKSGEDGGGDQPGTQEAQEFPEDSTEEPDILEVNLPDWDLGFTPLAHAVLTGSLETVQALLDEGADATLVNTSRDNGDALHPLTLTILRDNEDEASEILETLIKAGASTSTADDSLRTIFHRAVIADKIKLVSTILKHDPNAKAVLNFPSVNWNTVIYPLISAIDRRHYSMLATLLAHGINIRFTEEETNTTLETIPQKKLQNAFRYGNNKPFDGVCLPLETAIAKYDDVAQLLLSLDVDYNIGLYDSRGNNVDSGNRKSFLDWVQFGIAFLSKKIAASGTTDTEAPDAENLELTGWKKFYADYFYLVDIERLLLDKDAKSWNELYPESPSTAQVDDAQANESGQVANLTPFIFLGQYYSSLVVPDNLVSKYDELYEACFTGDDKKIEELCLPQEKTNVVSPPINIFVQVTDKSSLWSQTGHTPLFAAVSGRQWATAKLIMAIAVAQYKPPENTTKFSTKGVVLYEQDSDNDSEASDDSDATASPEEATFIDIAKRPSSVETDVHPKRLLDEARVTWYTGPDTQKELVQNNGKLLLATLKKSDRETGNLLLQAIHENDLDAFVTLFGLYISSPVAITLEQWVLETILNKDRVEMLDIYIRKTGQCIEIKQDHADPTVTVTNDKNKTYLGLTVHGKKRADLAKMSDPNAVPTSTSFPLVWTAARYGAKLIVEYLAGDRPLAAYHHYTTTGGDERAYQIRRIKNLDKVLPEWLGWTTADSGDSPLASAITGTDFQLLKTMFTKKPKLMASCLHQTIKFSGYNAILLAANMRCKPEMLDYLLAKSVSPAVNDTVRGWNVYHILCRYGYSDMIGFLLKKLPRDVSEALLAQPSKGRSNTPLHLAVKEGEKSAVNLIIDFSKATLLTRDIDGSTPLHCAIQRGYADITSTLIKAIPVDALYMENGVGETPLDMAMLKHTIETKQSFINEHNSNPRSLNVGNVFWQRRVELNGLEPEIQRLRQTVEHLVQDGKLIEGGKVAEELIRFYQLMEEKVVAEKAAEAAKPVDAEKEDDTEKQKDSNDVGRTLEVIAAAVTACPGKRQLVHLIDVQKSVQGNLTRFSSQQQTEVVHDDGEGLGVEEDEEAKEVQRSLVMACISESIRPDYY